jgi:hypothetical protein
MLAVCCRSVMLSDVLFLSSVNAPLRRISQMYLFRHFNLQLRPLTSSLTLDSFDATRQLPLAVQSAFLLAVDISALDTEIQHVLYTQTYK